MALKRFVILITGSRTWDTYDSIAHRITEAIGEWLEENPEFRKRKISDYVTVVHGGCPSGADRLADIFAREVLKCKVIVYLPDWSKYGKRAGMLRNLYMVEKSNADVALAFLRDRSKGTAQCRDAAKKFGIPTITYHYDNEVEIYPSPPKPEPVERTGI